MAGISFDLFYLNQFSNRKPSILSFVSMKDSIKKAPVNLWEDLLYFQHFIQIFDFAPNYHQLNMPFEADVVYWRRKKNKYGQFCAKYLSQYQK